MAAAARPILIAAAAYGLIAGAITFAGWLTGTHALTDWIGAGITMKANPALAAIAGGAALLLYASRMPGRIAACRALGVFVATVGGVTLLQHLTGWNAGIDTLLFDEPPGALATAAPGRMGPPAAASFLALGTALVLLTGGVRARGTAIVLALFALAIATLTLTGYWYGAEMLYTIARVSGIAAQMASIIAALAIGIIAADPQRQPMRTLCEEGVAGTLARRLLPVVILLPLVLGRLRLLGEEGELYDPAFGTSLRTLAEITLLSAFVWWSVRAIRERDLQRHRAERELHDSERRLRQTLASITDGFVAFDGHWRFTYVNPEAERLLQRPSPELLGREAWDAFSETAGMVLQRELMRAAREQVVVEFESPDAAGRYFSYRAFPTADGGLSVYFQDITARKQAQDALQEADQRKDRFLATLAHELRNPLAPIRNAAAALVARDSADSTVRWAGEAIGRQAQHMARLLDDLLDVSRITLNRLELRREWVNITEVVQAAADGMRQPIDAAGHELALDLPAEPIFVNGDPVRLAQVFSNLLSNAAKYTGRGGHICMTVTADDGEVIVRVRDDGLGIEADMLARVFEMFVQAPPALPHSQGGLGIGLWLAAAVVERHGGQIAAKSDGPGLGSEFIVRLPRVMQVIPGVSPPAPEELPPSARRSVLVVDDLQDSADSLAALLRSLGHDAEAVYSGEAAVDETARLHPDAVFLDIGMPGMDGLEACRRIRAAPWGRQVSIIAVTGWGQIEDRRRTAEAGFDYHLIKPVDPAVLATLLTSLPRHAHAPVAGDVPSTSVAKDVRPLNDC